MKNFDNLIEKAKQECQEIQANCITEHKVGNYLVYVDTSGYVTNGIKDMFGNGMDIRPVYPYRWSNNLRCWTRDNQITLSALRAGIKRETIALK